MGYLRSSVKGISWVGAFRLLTRLVAFLRTIVLARILIPAQFGVFGIATLVISLLEIFTETGINIFLIQKKKDISSYVSTAWVVSILRGLIISLILVAAAPLIAGFFRSPESKNAIYLISLVSLIRGFINPSIVKFQKELRFGEEFWFRFVVFVFDSFVAVLASLVSRSAVGMIWGLIAGAILELVLSFAVVKPRPRLRLEMLKLKEIVSKGKWISLAGAFQFLFRQGDDAVVGRALGEASLGTYQVAYKISSLPISEVTDVVNRVVFPVYVKIEGDRKRLTSAFIKTTATVTILAIFLGTTLFVFGERLVVLLLGDAWLGVVPLVKILSIFGVIQAINNSVNSLFLALEKQAYVAVVTLVSVIGLGLSIVPFVVTFGLPGAAMAPLFGSILGLPVMVFLVRRSLTQK